jgi:predicted O-methyltransferase YrrM
VAAVAGYVIRGGLAGRERLRVLARIQAAPTIRLLQRVRIPRGARCLDAGCGGGDVALQLARIAGPDGEAVGIDRDEVKLELARAEARDSGLDNVSYRVADVNVLTAEHEFDVVYSRFLLAHLADPAAALERLVAAARPGALVVLEDIDFTGPFCHPESRAYRRFWELFPAAVRAHGGDPTFGPALPGLLAGAGVRDVDVRVVQATGRDPDVKLMPALTFENSIDAIAGAGLARREAVEAMVDELYAFAAEPDTVVALPRVVQAWGRVQA